ADGGRIDAARRAGPLRPPRGAAGRRRPGDPARDRAESALRARAAGDGAVGLGEAALSGGDPSPDRAALRTGRCSSGRCRPARTGRATVSRPRTVLQTWVRRVLPVFAIALACAWLVLGLRLERFINRIDPVALAP